MKKIFSQSHAGFAMLFTVMLVGIILAIALGIAEITFKQTILSNLASDSQIAFYQADTAMECGMLVDYATTYGVASTHSYRDNINCGGYVLTLSGPPPTSDFGTYVYKPAKFDGPSYSSAPCFILTFIKTAGENTIEARGYNTCNPKSPRQVERALRVVY